MMARPARFPKPCRSKYRKPKKQLTDGKETKPTRSGRPCRLGNQKKRMQHKTRKVERKQDLQGFQNLVGLKTENSKHER